MSENSQNTSNNSDNSEFPKTRSGKERKPIFPKPKRVRKVRKNSTDQVESPSDILQDSNAFGFGPNTNQVKLCQWCIATGLSLGHKRCVVCSVDLSLDRSFLSELANSYIKQVFISRIRDQQWQPHRK
jgi:hypothetical protein